MVCEGNRFRFRIKERIDRGGNGEVYNVETEDYDGEPLAVIKNLPGNEEDAVLGGTV